MSHCLPQPASPVLSTGHFNLGEATNPPCSTLLSRLDSNQQDDLPSRINSPLRYRLRFTGEYSPPPLRFGEGGMTENTSFLSMGFRRIIVSRLFQCVPALSITHGWLDQPLLDDTNHSTGFISSADCGPPIALLPHEPEWDLRSLSGLGSLASRELMRFR